MMFVIVKIEDKDEKINVEMNATSCGKKSEIEADICKEVVEAVRRRMAIIELMIENGGN